MPSNIIKYCYKNRIFRIFKHAHITGISRQQMRFLVWKTRENQLETTPKKKRTIDPLNILFEIFTISASC
jgi:hypothetical protein